MSVHTRQMGHMHWARRQDFVREGNVILTTPEVLRGPLGPHDGRLGSRRRRTSVKLPSGVREALRCVSFQKWERERREGEKDSGRDEGVDEAEAAARWKSVVECPRSARTDKVLACALQS